MVLANDQVTNGQTSPRADALLQLQRITLDAATLATAEYDATYAAYDRITTHPEDYYKNEGPLEALSVITNKLRSARNRAGRASNVLNKLLSLFLEGASEYSTALLVNKVNTANDLFQDLFNSRQRSRVLVTAVLSTAFSNYLFREHSPIPDGVSYIGTTSPTSPTGIIWTSKQDAIMTETDPQHKYIASEREKRADETHERIRALQAELDRTPRSDEAKRDDLDRQIWELHLITHNDSPGYPTDPEVVDAEADLAKLMIEFHSTPRENAKRRAELLNAASVKLGWP